MNGATRRQQSLPDGPWIHRTEAMKRFKLGRTDLDRLVPISTQKNHRGGPNDIRRYNLADVIALKEHLDSQPLSPPQAPTNIQPKLAPKNGKTILRTAAMRDYKLERAQMDPIKPVKVLPNPHNTKTTMRYYNECDVVALKQSIEAGRAAPKRNAALFENL